MIAIVTLAEIEERKKTEKTQTVVLGYDPKKWVETEVQLRDGERHQFNYTRVTLPPPVQGKHKYSHCNHLYGDIHTFLANREWAPIDVNNKMGGTTWLELFVLFDTTQARSAKGTHVKSFDVATRASSRRGKKASESKEKSHWET